MLKGLSFDSRIKTILSRDHTLKPLQKPRHVNAIFSVAAIDKALVAAINKAIELFFGI